MSSSHNRVSLHQQARNLLDRTKVKLELVPLGCALDAEFLERMLAFIRSTQELLELGASVDCERELAREELDRAACTVLLACDDMSEPLSRGTVACFAAGVHEFMRAVAEVQRVASDTDRPPPPDLTDVAPFELELAQVSP